MSQLIEKALSTNSEEEAIACLRMARKRKETLRFDLYKNKTAEYWYKQAELLHKKLKVSITRNEYKHMLDSLVELGKQESQRSKDLKAMRESNDQLRRAQFY